MNCPYRFEKIIESIYIYAFQKAQQKRIDRGQYQRAINKKLKQEKIQFKSLQPYILYEKKEWIQDLMQITTDLKLLIQTKQNFYQKFQTRTKMHFGSGHLLNLEKQKKKSSSTKKVISMYNQTQPKQWDSDNLENLKNLVLQNSAYILGLTKGNGVIIQGKYFLTCAHAFMDDDNKIVTFRCFATGSGSYGIVRIQKNGLWVENDVVFGRIIKFFGKEQKSCNFYLSIPKCLKFNGQFKPIRCIQVGLLFNNDPKAIDIKLFQTSQGFIEKNLYQNSSDYRLVQQMGLLIHDCYGLWGTSGSPLWTSNGELLGIHNSWNENSYDVSMIVHDGDIQQCRVVKQYERRAISIHVLIGLYDQWQQLLKNQQLQNQDQPSDDNEGIEERKKKVKIC